MSKITIWTDLTNVFNRVFNKVYCRSLDSAFNKIKNSDIVFTNDELQAIRFLIQDIESLERKSHANKNKFF
jgi:hypothetical protein